jgi:hypothetical protein
MLSLTSIASTIASFASPYCVSSSISNMDCWDVGLSKTSSWTIYQDGACAIWWHSPMLIVPMQMSQKHDKCRNCKSVQS